MAEIRVESPTVHCTLDVFREGVLSRIGHDLRLSVERLELAIETDTLRARADATGVRVVCARRDGVELPGALSPSDVQKIEASIRHQVLHADRHPEVRFTCPWPLGARPSGTLTLAGVERPLPLRLRREGSELIAEATITPSDHGIPPYRALMGALRVADRVELRCVWREAPSPLPPAAS